MSEDLAILVSLTGLDEPEALTLLENANGNIQEAAEHYLAHSSTERESLSPQPTSSANYIPPSARRTTPTTTTTAATRAQPAQQQPNILTQFFSWICSFTSYFQNFTLSIWDFLFPPNLLQHAILQTPLLLQISLRPTNFVSSSEYLGYAARTNLQFLHITLAEWQNAMTGDLHNESPRQHTKEILRRFRPGFQLILEKGAKAAMIHDHSFNAVTREVDRILRDQHQHPADLNDHIRSALPSESGLRHRIQPSSSDSMEMQPLRSRTATAGVSQNREIIREQQSAYERSLMADQLKEVERLKTLDEAKLAETKTESRRQQHEAIKTEISTRVEPSSESSIMITFRFGNGSAITARFEMHETVEILYKYVAAQQIAEWDKAPTNDVLDEFYLAARFPTRKFLYRKLTLEQAGLKSDEALFVTQRDMEEDE